MTLLERCPHFRECYVEDSIELGPEDVEVFQGVLISEELGPERCVPTREVYQVKTSSSP